MHVRRVGTIMAAVVALGLAGCTVGPSARPPVAVRGADVPSIAPTPVPAPEAPGTLPDLVPQQTSLRFSDCTTAAATRFGVPAPAGSVVECAELPVPVDAMQPQLGSLLLEVVRIGPADGPPLLVLGDSVTGGTAGHALTVAAGLDPAVRDTFAVIGIDRRGLGLDRLDCSGPESVVDARAALIDADPTATSDGDLAAFLEDARAVVQGCSLTPPGVPTAYGAVAGAADVEALRTRLGVPQLSAVGAGDGATTLAVWARSAPGAVGRLVLDGPPAPETAEPARTAERAAAAGAALNAFAVACTRTGACPLGPDPVAGAAAAVDALRARPLAAPDGRRVTAGAAQHALLLGLAEPAGWPALAAGLAAAGAGDPLPLLDLIEPVASPVGRFDGLLATACNDGPARLSPPEIGTLAAQLRDAHPLVGDRMALDLLACAPWPAVTGPAGGDAPDLPPLLVVGTAADPRAPLEGSRRLAQELTTARFLQWQGAGTGAYPRTPCVRRVVDALLVEGRLPETTGLCPP